MVEILRIPAERVNILVGTNGKMKKRLEELTKTKIEVNEDGEITLTGESAQEFFLKDVIKAIGRGFEPNVAEKLLNENYLLEIIDLKEVCKTENDLKRIKGRIIGEKGKMKTEIETAVDCKISVYGWTVGIIAHIDTMEYAKKAIEKIIFGAQLTNVFNDLARYRKEILSNKLLGK